MNTRKARAVLTISLVAFLTVSMGCTQPVTKREQGGLIGGGLGTATGAIIGSATGHAAAGALIDGPIGLLAGALIGDQVMGQDQRQEENQAEITRLRREVERLRRENERLLER